MHWSDTDPIRLLVEEGDANYSGEPVSQLEHALQTAALARAAGAPDTLVVAALLHDIGHLGHSAGEDATERGIDARHEAIGARMLSEMGFPEAVTEPVRLHVPAKRWLCRDAEYAAALSQESVRSLHLQGGPMSDLEAAAFRAMPWAEAAIQLRRWDDEAKVASLAVPGVDAYVEPARQLRSQL